MAKNRSIRIEGEFKRALSEIFLSDLKDPRMSKMAGVTRVEVTQDLKYAKVYVSIYDTEEKTASTMEALKSAEGFIRAKLNDKIKLRRIPNLTFIHDTSIEYSVEITRILNEIHEKAKEGNPADAEDL